MHTVASVAGTPRRSSKTTSANPGQTDRLTVGRLRVRHGRQDPAAASIRSVPLVEQRFAHGKSEAILDGRCRSDGEAGEMRPETDDLVAVVEHRLGGTELVVESDDAQRPVADGGLATDPGSGNVHIGSRYAKLLCPQPVGSGPPGGNAGSTPERTGVSLP